MSTALMRGREARGSLPALLTIAAGRSHTAETILRAWFENKAEHTIRGYRHDLEDFAMYLSRALSLSPPLNAAYPPSRGTRTSPSLTRRNARAARRLRPGSRACADCHVW